VSSAGSTNPSSLSIKCSSFSCMCTIPMQHLYRDANAHIRPCWTCYYTVQMHDRVRSKKSPGAQVWVMWNRHQNDVVTGLSQSSIHDRDGMRITLAIFWYCMNCATWL
jgi:hypothetical protein